MLLFDQTFDSPAANIAFDEALLDAAEAGEIAQPALRLWESEQHFVVLGRSSSAEIEVNLTACREKQVSVLRRASGGGTVVAGPGCLMYAVVLPYRDYPQLRAVDLCHEYVLGEMTRILAPYANGVEAAGTSDLAIPGEKTLVKFSGNAMRCKKSHVLYHGTILYDFDLQLLSQLLATPTREPEYRENRNHRAFVSNLDIARSELRTSMIEGWNATQQGSHSLEQRTQALIEKKYTTDPKWVIYQPSS